LRELYIGLMSGTSTDGVDAALVDFGNNTVELVDFVFHPFDAGLKAAIRRLSNTHNRVSLVEYGGIDCHLGRLFAHAANVLIANNRLSANSIQAIGSHGQTVCHAPNSPFPFSLQIGDPNIIAENTGITTVADFRRRDIACNGQGAPLVPAFHQALFRHPALNRCIVNIGGIANITVLPASKNQNKKVFGFDTGPGNTLMDEWVFRYQSLPFDRNGDWAKTGAINHPLVGKLKQDAYFRLPPPKSTGKEYFSLEWLGHFISGHDCSPEDIQASLCQLTAVSICDAIRDYAPMTEEVLICGGGAHNGFLIDRISTQLACPIVSTAHYGVDPDHVEAMAFAWLARQTLKGLPGNLTEVTGSDHPRCLGGIYPAKTMGGA